MFILKVTWDNQVTETFRSDLAGADFKAQIPHVVEAKELGYALD